MKETHLNDGCMDACENDVTDLYTLLKYKEKIDTKLKNLRVLKQKFKKNEPDLSNIKLHLNVKNNDN